MARRRARKRRRNPPAKPRGRSTGESDARRPSRQAPRSEHDGIDDSHGDSLARQAEQRAQPDADRRSRRAPPANQIQPCNEPDATPPTNAPMLQPKPMRAPQPISRPPSAAASSDRAGGQAVRANGFGGRRRRHGAENHAEISQARCVGEDRIRRARASGPAIARIRRWRNRRRRARRSSRPTP